MKILVVTPTFLPIIGGAELGIYEIYQRLGKRHHVKILTPQHTKRVVLMQGEVDDFFDKKTFEVCHFVDRWNPSRFRLPQQLLDRFALFSFSYIPAVFRAVKNFRPDIINFHYAIPGGLALNLVRQFTKIPVVLSLIGRTDVLTDETPFLKKHFVSWTIKSASCITPISNYVMERSSAAKCTQIIPYGVDTNRFSPYIKGDALKKKLGIDKDGITLFALQRLSMVKRTDILIRSLPYLLEKCKDAVLIVGGKGPAEKALKDLARDLNISERVIFVGYIPEQKLPEFFAMADIFVFHSTNETFGIVLAQAMASGIPIVSVRSTSIPEVVDNGENGILVEPLNPEQFAAAVLELLNDPDKMNSFSGNGRAKAIERYSWDVVATQYEQVFESLL